jgi:hypothetical protein
MTSLETGAEMTVDGLAVSRDGVAAGAFIVTQKRTAGRPDRTS